MSRKDRRRSWRARVISCLRIAFQLFHHTPLVNRSQFGDALGLGRTGRSWQEIAEWTMMLLPCLASADVLRSEPNQSSLHPRALGAIRCQHRGRRKTARDQQDHRRPAKCILEQGISHERMYNRFYLAGASKIERGKRTPVANRWHFSAGFRIVSTRVAVRLGPWHTKSDANEAWSDTLAVAL